MADAPASNAAPQVASPAAVATPPPAAAEAPQAQPPAAEPAKVETPAPKDDATKAMEARAEALGRAARAAAKLQARESELDKRNAQLVEDQRLAADYRRLDKLRQEDPVKYMEAVGLKLGEVSKAYLQQKTAKTPEQVAEEVYTRKTAEAETKRQAEQAEANRLAGIKRQEDAYAGAKKQLETFASSDPVRFELCSVRPGEAAREAFELITKFWDAKVKETGVGEYLGFDKAMDAIERKYEAEELPKLANSKKLEQYREKLKAEAEKKSAEEKKKPEAGSKEVRSGEARETVETEVKPSPNSKPLRRLMPRDTLRIATELLLANQAAKDS